MPNAPEMPAPGREPPMPADGFAEREGLEPLWGEAESPEAPARRNVLLAAAALLAVLALAGIAYQLLAGANDPAVQQAPTSQDAQELPQLADYDSEVYLDGGNPISLTQIAAGRPLVLNFWATWCPYCIDELPDFQEIRDEYGDRVSFAFVDATDGTRETVDDARSFVQQNGYDLPVYYDIDRKAVADYGITAFPTTVVVAADGSIQVISPGTIDPQKMRQALDSLLEG